MNNNTTILDIGSGKITGMIAGKVKSDFVISTCISSLYEGYDEDGWYDVDSLKRAVKECVDALQERTGNKIRELVVGVPGRFCTVETGEATLVFRSKKRIDEFDVNDIEQKANVFGERYGKVIGQKSVYYLLDGVIKTVKPIGKVATRITGLISFSFVKDDFTRVLRKIFNSLGVKNVRYVSTCEKQAEFISNALGLDGYAVIIDVGHISTDVMLTGDRTLLFSRSISLGSGFISADLAQVLSIDYDQAVELTQKINLKLEFGSGDVYRIGNVACDAFTANEVAKCRIEEIAEYVKQAYSYCDKAVPVDTPVVITGGGLVYVKGAVDVFSFFLGKDVTLYDNVNPQLMKNEYTSSYGLVAYAIGEKKCSSGGLRSLLKKLGGR